MKLLLLYSSSSTSTSCKSLPCFCLASVVSMGTLSQRREKRPNQIDCRSWEQARVNHLIPLLLATEKRYFRKLVVNTYRTEETLLRLLPRPFPRNSQKGKSERLFLFTVFTAIDDYFLREFFFLTFLSVFYLPCLTDDLLRSRWRGRRRQLHLDGVSSDNRNRQLYQPNRPHPHSKKKINKKFKCFTENRTNFKCPIWKSIYFMRNRRLTVFWFSKFQFSASLDYYTVKRSPTSSRLKWSLNTWCVSNFRSLPTGGEEHKNKKQNV
jgi:hypothetical protein